jgi:putative membrane protein
MSRVLSIATALAVAIALPAFAETATKTPAGATEAGPAARTLFTEEQARTHLVRLGYADVSVLTKNENGVWHGTATKNGKQLNVAVDVKGAVANN